MAYAGTSCTSSSWRARARSEPPVCAASTACYKWRDPDVQLLQELPREKVEKKVYLLIHRTAAPQGFGLEEYVLMCKALAKHNIFFQSSLLAFYELQASMLRAHTHMHAF
eukprot:1154358-Pelagomonas_calceolata.AAC.15